MVDRFLILTVFAQFTRLAKSLESNVAVGSNSRVDFCGVNISDPVLVDGERQTPQRMNKACPINAYYTISLNSRYVIHYVMIYEGKSSGVRSKLLNYFKVQLSTDGSNYTACSQYPTPSKGPFYARGMRVNCMAAKVPYGFVKIHSRLNEGLDIAEVEVYSFGELDGLIFIQRGCFKDFPIAKDAKTFDMTDMMICYRYCVSQKFGFIAIKDNLTCECGENYDPSDEISLKACHYRCFRDEFRCGGDGVFSVYLVNFELPSYTFCGTIKGNPTFHKKETVSNLTIQKCIKICEEYQFAIMEGGTECMCPDVEQVNLETSETQFCDVPCAGDTGSICGGRGHYSIYKTCLPGKALLCSFLFQCHGNFDQYGVCPRGCKTGYLGLHCLEGGLMTSEVDVIVYLQLLIPIAVILIILTCLLGGSKMTSSSYSQGSSSKSSVVAPPHIPPPHISPPL